MSVTVAVLKETRKGERRVSIVPTVAVKISQLGATLAIETKAGLAATFPDAAYAGARFQSDGPSVVADADIVLAVQPPAVEVVEAMKPGAVLIAFLYGPSNPQLVAALQAREVTALAMEAIPRISRAQAMDALSSQAALAGYYAPLLGAVNMPRILPMMTTAVGSLRAAKVLVMGLGVAGLSALATARRLGAITEGYDVRPETKEQALSLGAKFVETGVDARGEGGYARELTAQEQDQVQSALSKHIAEADMIITTASVPGRPAPRLISAAQIAAMKPGAVIVDLSAEGGGNCEGAKPGETVVLGPTTLVAPLNVPSALAQHSSELYAKNILNLLQLIVKDGAIHLDFDDEVLAGTVLTHAGKIMNPAVRERLQGASPAQTPVE